MNKFLEQYLERFENSEKYLVAVAEAMPEQKYGYKPTADEKTFAEQLMHIASGLDLHAQTFLADKEERPASYFAVSGKTKREIINFVHQIFKDAGNVISSFEPDRFDDTLNYDIHIRTKRQIFFLLADHITHHRAQLLVYMRLNGIAPPEYEKYQ